VSSSDIINSKKRVLYSVCGEGLGHGIRSGVIIKELLKKYDVWVFSSDRAYKYLSSKFDNVYEIGGFNTVYQDNRVSNRKTLYQAIKDTPSNLRESYGILYKKAKEFKPNIIITDFENYANSLGKIIDIPVLSVDNIHMITKTRIDYPEDSRREMLKAKGVIKSYLIRPKRYILTSFFKAEIKNPEIAVLYPPVIREEIMKIKPSYKDHILVYQTSKTDTLLFDVLKELDEKFIVYGFNEDKIDGNLTFRKFNENKIYDELSSSKAVICNGGFSFISEAFYLKKPIFSMPVRGQFEQLLNGYYVEKLNYGMMSRDTDHNKLKEKINKFLNNLKQYQETLKTVENTDNSGIIKEIENSIERFAVKNN
ncbi:MAG: teichoic acid biosynthesis protein, partial [Methanobrevibacter sp.]|nr:teichoic acid biosynthesis protein [Methanobrevibacter sp.]